MTRCDEMVRDEPLGNALLLLSRLFLYQDRVKYLFQIKLVQQKRYAGAAEGHFAAPGPSSHHPTLHQLINGRGSHAHDQMEKSFQLTHPNDIYSLTMGLCSAVSG
jgi:hypothetical protein